MNEFSIAGIMTEHDGEEETVSLIIELPPSGLHITFNSPEEMLDLAKALKRNAKMWKKSLEYRQETASNE